MRLNNDSALRVPADGSSGVQSREVSLKKLKPKFGHTSKINQESRTSEMKDGTNQGSNQTSQKKILPSKNFFRASSIGQMYNEVSSAAFDHSKETSEQNLNKMSSSKSPVKFAEVAGLNY